MSCLVSVELGSLTTANLMEKVKGLQNLAYQLGLEECEYMNNTHKQKIKGCWVDPTFLNIKYLSYVATRWCS